MTVPEPNSKSDAMREFLTISQQRLIPTSEIFAIIYMPDRSGIHDASSTEGVTILHSVGVLNEKSVAVCNKEHGDDHFGPWLRALMIEAGSNREFGLNGGLATLHAESTPAGVWLGLFAKTDSVEQGSKKDNRPIMIG